MFAGKAEAYPTEAPFRCSTLGGRLLALPTNIRLGRRELPDSNTPVLKTFGEDHRPILNVGLWPRLYFGP